MSWTVNAGPARNYTSKGTLIDIYDDLPLLTKVPDSGLLFDAAWTTEGAYCIQKERWLKLRDLPSFRCAADFVNLELAEPDPSRRASPVDPQDQCLMRRTSQSRDDVHIDNRSGINVAVE